MIISQELDSFLKVTHSREPVGGLTHTFYRYPARFSPSFARAAIVAFTKPGDLVLDPFMGAGTTLVEARVLGRRAIGVDINALAVFITEVKTKLVNTRDIVTVQHWAKRLVKDLNLRNLAVRADEWIALGYQHNISGRQTWPVRKILELALAHVEELPTNRQQNFARCVLLRTAQWALDCREEIPAAEEFRRQFFADLHELSDGAVEFAACVRRADHRYKSCGKFRTLCLHRSAVGIDEDAIISQETPKLILTSPPYPGVHVLYHRWQIHGRRETPAPFWIANRLDGNGAAFYTFGDRKQQKLAGYFKNIRGVFASLARIANDQTIIVQMVAFAEPKWQLPKYLETLQQAGLCEVKFPTFANSLDGRLWRSVPNRKWYADRWGAIASSKEVVLFHQRTK